MVALPPGPARGLWPASSLSRPWTLRTAQQLFFYGHQRWNPEPSLPSSIQKSLTNSKKVDELVVQKVSWSSPRNPAALQLETLGTSDSIHPASTAALVLVASDRRHNSGPRPAPALPDQALHLFRWHNSPVLSSCAIRQAAATTCTVRPYSLTRYPDVPLTTSCPNNCRLQDIPSPGS